MKTETLDEAVLIHWTVLAGHLMTVTMHYRGYNSAEM